ncbi:hypothetical protein BP6252_06529 [Coleophoma cylindrospora]|uniref:glutathione transferase n=1 Tax=Coleophoma cylindrospora TaxID=1849047 RepID=A0A3D8RMU3_9HELO|nr:hypothetical protein BP6252_06529 [Coleophoma cylindrospora]
MAFTLTGVEFAYTVAPLLVLAEKGITDFELREPDFSTLKQKPHIDKNPFGQVPILEDNGFVLYEARAIARYLAEKFQATGPALIPAEGDIKAWGLFEQFASSEHTNFHHFVQVIIAQKYYNPLNGRPVDPTITEYFEKRFNAKLDVYDVILAKQKYMGGDEFSLIDIFYMPQIGTLFTMGDGAFVTSRPNIKAWWQRVSARDSWKKYAASVAEGLS